MKTGIRWGQSGLVARYMPFILILVLGLIWGGLPTISKYVTEYGVPPLSYAFWVLVFSSSILTGINFIRTRKLPPRHLSFYVICGLTGTAVPSTILFYSVLMIPAGLVVLIITLTPIFTYIFSLVFKAEQYHPLKTLGLLLAFGGIVLIMMPDSVAEMKAPVAGILLAILIPTLYAVNIVYTALQRPANLHVIDLTTGMLVASVVVLLLVNLLFNRLYPIWEAPPLILGLTVYHGVVSALAFCLFFYLIHIAGALFSSQVTYCVTVFGIAYGAYVHDEVLPFLVWIAAILMFAGIGVIQKARKLTSESRSA